MSRIRRMRSVVSGVECGLWYVVCNVWCCYEEFLVTTVQLNSDDQLTKLYPHVGLPVLDPRTPKCSYWRCFSDDLLEYFTQNYPIHSPVQAVKMKGRQMYTIPRQGSGESGSGYSVRSDDLRSVAPLQVSNNWHQIHTWSLNECIQQCKCT